VTGKATNRSGHVQERPATHSAHHDGSRAHNPGRRSLGATLLLALLAGVPARADDDLIELHVGNSLYRIHEDEYEIAKSLMALGVGMNFTDGRVNQMFLPTQRPLTPQQLQPIRKLSGVTALSLPWWATDETLAVFTRQGEFTRLKSLGLDHAKITDAGLRNLDNLPALECMNLSTRDITDEGVVHVGKVESLLLLRLNGTAVTDEGLKHLAGLKKLHHLELNDTKITDAGLANLAGNTALQTLYLKGTSIDGRGLRHLAGLARLSNLNLDDTRLDDRGIANLAEFPNLRRIEVLYLANTKITDAGLASLRSLTNLRVLNLCGTEMTDAGLHHLTNHPRIYNLGLGPRVTAEGYKWLEANATFAYPFRQAVYTKPARGPRKPQTPPAAPPVREGVLGLIDALDKSDFEPATKAAVEKLVAMKTEAAGPILQSIVERKDHSRFHYPLNAGSVLARIGPDAVPIMIDYYARHHEIELMRRTVHDAATRAEYDLLPFAGDLLESSNPGLRYLGVDLLEVHLKDKKPLTQAFAEKLIERLRDPDAEVRTLAARAAGYVTVAEADVARGLVGSLLGEKEGEPARMAAISLVKIAKRHAKGTPVLRIVVDGLARAAADHPEYRVRVDAIERLGTLGIKAEPAAPVLQTLSDTDNVWLSKAAAKALGDMGVSIQRALRAANVDPALEDALLRMASSDSAEFSAAFRELEAKGPTAIDAMLIAARADETGQLPSRLANVMASWDTGVVWPKLSPFVADKSPPVRRMIAFAWRHVGFGGPPEAPGDYLRDEDLGVRHATVHSLIYQAGRSSDKARARIGRFLAQALENEGWGYHLWRSAAHALAECHPDYPDAVPVLTRLLRDARLPSSRGSAADALERIARPLNGKVQTFDTIVTALIEAREKETDEDIQSDIVSALATVADKDPKALAALHLAQKSRFPSVSRAATRAIDRIENPRSREYPEPEPEEEPPE